jgi:hypothetical protein
VHAQRDAYAREIEQGEEKRIEEGERDGHLCAVRLSYQMSCSLALMVWWLSSQHHDDGRSRRE